MSATSPIHSSAPINLSDSDPKENNSNIDHNDPQKITGVASKAFSWAEQIEPVIFNPFAATSASSSSLSPHAYAKSHSKSLELKKKIHLLNSSISVVEDTEVRSKNSVRFNYLIETLKVLAQVTTPHRNLSDIGLEAVLLKRIDTISTFIARHFSSVPEVELGDFFDFWELDLAKLTYEIRNSRVKSSILEIIPDKLTRDYWEREFGSTYSVSYNKFYNKVILKIFPEMIDDNNFRDFIKYLTNPLGEKVFTAYSWKLFVDLLGPIDSLHDNVRYFEKHPCFTGNMSRLVAENLLLDYHKEYPEERGKSIIRFSRTRPGSLVISYYKQDSRGAIQFIHFIPNRPTSCRISNLGGRVAGVINDLQKLSNRKIYPLNLNISFKIVLKDLLKIESPYISIHHPTAIPENRYTNF